MSLETHIPQPGASRTRLGNTSPYLEATAGDIWYQEVPLEGATRRCCFQVWWHVPSPRSHPHGTTLRSFREKKATFIGEEGVTGSCRTLCRAAVVWSHLCPFLQLPGDQGPHHALQLRLEGTLSPRPPPPPPSARAPGGHGQRQQPPHQCGCYQGTAQQGQPGQQEPLHRAARPWGHQKTPKQGVQGWLWHLGWWMGLSTHLRTTAPSPSAPAMVQPSPGVVSPLLGRLQENMSCPCPRTPTRPQNPAGPPQPSPSTWRLSKEGVSRGTASVTAVAQGTPGRVLCIVPAGRRGRS